MEISDIVRKLQDIATTTDNETKAIIANTLLLSISKNDKKLSLESLAEKSHVSPATLVRFLQKLGYSNYAEYNQSIATYRKRIYSDNLNKQKAVFEKNNSFENNLERYGKLVQNSIAKMIGAIDKEQVDRFCAKIYEHEHIYFFGVQSSGAILRELQYSFLNVGKFIHYADGRLKQKNNTKSIKGGSLIVVLSVYGNFFPHMAETLWEFNFEENETILITGNTQAKIVRLFDEVVNLSNPLSMTTGSYQAQVFADILISRYRELYVLEK
ncbi:transcriptional regulator, RpiR family [Pilibacter termitis]|uniref:Transcriptional regulator, RpiR family n=1 Tax=Pilibacter termitis TaxID=263852 RepID=A0A1T4MZ22_9ENTE|nr:MurR/RpiR family transcriptional regulator [Pilibacter termitis]SJZ72242.1 transcriptional regulator, RpiR family [Pilibacter termitis]